MNIDQQYLKNHENAGGEDEKAKETPASNGAEKGKGTTTNTKGAGKTYDVEGFKALADQKNSLKDEGMNERNGE